MLAKSMLPETLQGPSLLSLALGGDCSPECPWLVEDSSNPLLDRVGSMHFFFVPGMEDQATALTLG